jgi:hypothetical protein
LTELTQEIKNLINTHQTSMTQYQIDHFVVGEKMTPYRILKQILLELESRYRNLEVTEMDLKIEKLRIKQMQARLDKITDTIEKEIQELEIAKREIDLSGLEKTILNNKYEIGVIEAQYVKLKEQYEDTKSLLASPDGEEEYWVNKFIKEAQVDIMTSGRVGKGVLDAMMSLPNDVQNLILTNAIGQAANSNVYISAVEDHYLSSIKEKQQGELMLDTVIKKVEES